MVEKTYSGIVAGIDEAGRGPWAGPVVAAAVVITERRKLKGIDDSKKLKAQDRAFLYLDIMAHCHVGVGEASVEEIDSMNILNATLLAMSRAYQNLPVVPDVALVDGNRPPKLACEVKTIIAGDASCLSIAAASIIAKVTRDRIMESLSRDHPHYGWETNAGYGTEKHQQGLAHHGITPHHRRSFRPIREIMERHAA